MNYEIYFFRKLEIIELQFLIIKLPSTAILHDINFINFNLENRMGKNCSLPEACKMSEGEAGKNKINLKNKNC